MATRKIIHLDMDCFYAAVEMRERPELAGRPVAVGGGSRRGVVTTCNYEARAFGVRSAMPGFKARELCPHLVFLPVRFELYREESRRIRSLMLEYTERVEPLSLDEAYLDVTGGGCYAWDTARELRRRIRETTGLTASAGVAPNKMLAKIASDWRKPDGQFAVTPDQVEAFMRDLPVGRIWGVGPKTGRRLAEIGVETCGQLQKVGLPELVRRFGSFGSDLFRLCRGEDDREVVPSRPRKSLSNERTFPDSLSTLEDCQRQLDLQIGELTDDLRCKAPERGVRKLFVKLKFDDFQTTTRECISNTIERALYHDLLREAFGRSERDVRLLGVGIRFAEEGEKECLQPELDLA